VDNHVEKVMDSTIWTTLQEKIKNKIGEMNYAKWFTFVRPIRTDEGSIVLGVPDKFFFDWISEYYLAMMGVELRSVTGGNESLSLEIDPSLAAEIDKKMDDESPVPQARLQIQPKETVSQISGLNPKYTFDKFVVGSGNQFAHAAAKAVADLPGGHYNPLFVYGGVGLGKTHLVSAIGLEILRKNPDARVLYVTAENFMNEVIFGIRYDKMVELRKKYRTNCDVLLMDDIQFLGGKERTQEEFFHTFNTLLESTKQIVVTSDRFPKDISDIDDRLRSRFEWGLIADIQPPDLETRIAILNKKAEAAHFELPNDVAIFLANRIRSNIRELEGSLIRLFAYSSLFKSTVTIEFAEQVLAHIVNKNAMICSIESIQKMVSDYFKIRPVDIKSTRRVKSLVVPRQIAMYLCKKHAGASFPEIGEKFGGKDHTTVIHAFRKIESLLTTNNKMKEDVDLLEKKLTNP